VKTTLEMPDATLRKAKAKAAERGIPLRQFVTEAVEAKLEERPSNGKPWTVMGGALKHLHAETVRIQKLIDDEFEQIEPEDWE
jgi:cytochrome c-type biogenesis protein CcmH/NrfG